MDFICTGVPHYGYNILRDFENCNYMWEVKEWLENLDKTKPEIPNNETY